MSDYRLRVEHESVRTVSRVVRGELINGPEGTTPIARMSAVVALAEEMGEVAEQVKVLCGYKPKAKGGDRDHHLRLLQDELIQVSSICELMYEGCESQLRPTDGPVAA